MDDYAAHRAFELRNALSNNPPLVFCGLNDYKGDSWILKRPKGDRAVGVLERVTYLETAEMALQLRPGTKEIVVVDAGAADFPYADDIVKKFPGLRGRYLRAGKMTFAELAGHLERLKEGTVVIASGITTDVNGRLVSFEDGIRWVTSHSPVPVFGISKRSLGLGIVGGKLSDGYFQGKTAGEMANRILGGAPLSELKTVSDAGEPYLVDYGELKKWGMDERLLPAGTVVVGRPASLYEEHKLAVWSAAAFLGMQSLVIALLGMEMKRRMKAERRLAASAEQYRAIFEQSPMGMVEVSLDGHWGMMNQKACEITGWKPAEREGTTTDKESGDEAWRVLLDSKSDSSSEEGQIVHKNGRRVWVNRTFSLIRDAEQQPRGFMLTLEDTTRRKEAEQQLLRSNAALRHFAYAAAHDLQEPLRNVALSAGLLTEDYAKVLDEFGQKLLRENVDSAQRMLGMVKGLLSYSEALGAAEDKAPQGEGERALASALLHLQPAIEEAGMRVRHSPLPAVSASEGHLVQLFQNLIGNAIQYRNRDRPGEVMISAQRNGAEWIFEIADNGIGFEPMYAERIFGVFSGSITEVSIRAQGLDWRFARGLWSTMAGGFGRKENR